VLQLHQHARQHFSRTKEKHPSFVGEILEAKNLIVPTAKSSAPTPLSGKPPVNNPPQAVVKAVISSDSQEMRQIMRG